MKLLFDQNLSHRLVGALEDLYPGSAHVRALRLDSADDSDVWAYARAHGFAVVSKDSDFHQLAFLHGPPPKAVWLQIGNCTTSEIEGVLRSRHEEVIAFGENVEEAFLVLGR